MKYRIERKVVCFDHRGHIYHSVKAENDSDAKQKFLDLYEKESFVEIIKERIECKNS